MDLVNEIFERFERHGADAYFGEPVSQAEHALQAAFLAEQSGANDALIISALLHDVGHLLHGLPEDIAAQGVDARHEDVGAAWLSRHFDPEVTEPMHLHVAAKRYLCAVEPDYLATLSPASLDSLRLQGGPMSLSEQKQFETNTFYREAVALRKWDDMAKEVGLAVPDLEHYRARLERLCRA